MPTPILYIGIGSSGLEMLEAAQSFLYSAGRTCSPDHTRFLFIETAVDKQPSNILGKPKGREAIEAFPTPLAGVVGYRDDFARRAAVRVRRTDSPPTDAVAVLTVRDRAPERLALDAAAFPEGLYTEKATVFSRTSRTLTNSAFGQISEWMQGIGLSEGCVSVKKVNERLEVYLPAEVPEFIALRVEVLFNELELSTRLVSRRTRETEETREIETVCWLPPRDLLTAVGNDGAGGMRNVGRMALWRPSHLNMEGNNLSILKDKVSDLAGELQAACGGALPVVYIAGTFAGGTNSGMFIDVAYLCREAIDPARSFDPYIFGLFLLPRPTERDAALTANAYACLRDLAHFSSMDSQFLGQWPRSGGIDLAPFEQGSSPFRLVTLMSTSWVEGGDLSKLIHMAGLFLFLMGTEFVSYRKARTVDAPLDGGQIFPWKFSAIGLTGYFYPRGEIRVCAACRIAEEDVLGALVSDAFCRDEEGASTTLADMLSARAEEFIPQIEEALEKCFDHIVSTGPGGKDSLAAFRDYLAKVEKKELAFERSKVEELLQASGDIYRQAVPAAKTAVEQILRAEVNRIVAEEVDLSRNLRHGLAVAKAIGDHLHAKVLGFWESLDVEIWDLALRGGEGSLNEAILDRVYEDRHGWALSRKKLRLNRSRDALRLLCVNVLQPRVKVFSEELRQGSIEHEDALRYPHLLSVARLAGTVGMVESAIGILRGYQETIERGIAHGLNDNDPFRFLLPQGEFSEEVEVAVRVRRNTGTVDGGTIAEDENGQRKPLLAALQAFAEADKLADAARDLLTASLEKANLPQIPPGKSIEDCLNLGGVENLANMAVQRKSVTTAPGVGLTTAARHPRVIVCDSADKAERLHGRHQLSRSGYDLTRSKQGATAALEDMVVFFDEAQLNSLEDLEAYARWRPGYDQNSPLGTLDAYLLT